MSDIALTGFKIDEGDLLVRWTVVCSTSYLIGTYAGFAVVQALVGTGWSPF
jgi:hypothetical protein